MNSKTLQTTLSSPTVVLIDKNTKSPAWGATVSGRRAFLCFQSVEVAESYRRNVVGSRKNGYRVKRLSKKVWTNMLGNMQRRRIQFCSVIVSTQGGTVSKLQVPIKSYLACHKQSELEADNVYPRGNSQKM